MKRKYLKKRTKDYEAEETSLLGAQVPRSSVLYIALFCIATEKSKSSIVRNLVEKFVTKTRKKHPEKELIKIIIDLSFDAWLNRTGRKTIFAAFLRGLRLELASNGKKLPEDMIIKITDKVKIKYEEKAKKNKSS